MISTETVDTPKAGANEFPDIVGAKPENPYLASFRPYIPASVNLREFTPLPIIVGTVLGMIFGASSLYLVLKTGLTVSASIPVGVISITLFRAMAKMGFRSRTILENNIVQTAGSAGESIAFGVGVTMPAILILGFELEVTRVLLVAVLGGLLGILMMIPLRRALIVQQHGLLKYPEGTACAEVLKAGASEESVDEAGKTIRVGRQVEGGLEIFDLPLPAAVSAQKGLNEPRYPTLKGIMGAKKKEIKDVKAADLGLASEAPALSVVKLEALPPRPPGRIIPGDPAEAAKALVKALREDAKAI